MRHTALVVSNDSRLLTKYEERFYFTW